MTWQGFLQFFLILGIVLAMMPWTGLYLYKVFEEKKTPLDRLLVPLEKLIYRLCQVDNGTEQYWRAYINSLLLFNIIMIPLLFLILIGQKFLPMNPDGLAGLPILDALTGSISAITGTGWQNYQPEQALSHFSHIFVFSLGGFFSGAVAISVAAALVRGITAEQKKTIGNFWVDMTRSILWVLLPLALITSSLLVASGVPQNFSPRAEAITLEKKQQVIPEGPVAAQTGVSLVTSAGAGFYGTGAAHPYQNPNIFSNYLSLIMVTIIPLGFISFFARKAGDSLEGWALMVVVSAFLMSAIFISYSAESKKNPLINGSSVDQLASENNIGGNMEGKEVRFGITHSVLSTVMASITADGTSNASLDSLNPFSIMALQFNLMLGQSLIGSAGSGFYHIIPFIILAAFLANLLAGRNPQYLRKKIDSYDIGIAAICIVTVPCLVAGCILLQLVFPGFEREVFNPGPHAMSQIVYNFSSAALNNGSFFAGLNPGKWHIILIDFAMLAGRYSFIILALALAGSFASKRKIPASDYLISSNTPSFAIVLFVFLVIYGILVALPFMGLGGIAEHFMVKAGKSF